MFRDPPHYLRQLKRTTTPRRLMWLSCYGYNIKRNEHYESRFQSAALGRTWWTARANVRKDAVDPFGDPSDLWCTVARYCPVGRRVVLFAYDLAEQMRLSQMLTELPRLGWSLDKIVLERTAAWCLLRSGKRSLLCCDLLSWLPVPWETIAHDHHTFTGIPQQITAGLTYAEERTALRVTIIRDTVLQILEWIEGENNGPFRPTGSGQSYSAYRRRFATARLLVHDDGVRLAAERRAMHTGRAEAWRHGSLRAGPFVECDLRAAYATIGRTCDVPTIARSARAEVATSRLAQLVERYAVLANVTVTTDVECIPYHVNARTMWPVGTFNTWIWDPEIRLALAYCKKVKCHHAYLYERGPAIRDFCAYVLDGMEGQTQVYGPAPQRVLKHWSRCLVGRLGLRYRLWIPFGEQHPPDVRLVTFLDVDEGTKTDMLLAGTRQLLLGDMTEAPESLPQIPGWVMSECRRKLWDAMALVGLGNLVYCDTDSVILQSRATDTYMTAFTGLQAPEWSLKNHFQRLTIYGPRNIEVGSERRISGLPLTARQTAPLEFTGEVMRSVKRSMRNGELDRVVTLPREFRVTPQDLRRQHNPDGSTSPFRIEVSDGSDTITDA